MFDLHIHSLLSDGVLLPSEIAMRYQALGYRVIAITDHCDYSNIECNVKSILKFTKHWPKESPIKILPGIELTHLPLEQYKVLVKYARKKGIKIIVAHGETQSEPVPHGTNQAAIDAGVDILAHPGNINEEDVILAKKKNVFLEITSRQSHKISNAHVVNLSKKFAAKLILNTDSHSPDDIIPYGKVKENAASCGLSQKDIEKISLDTEAFLKRLVKFV